MPGQDKRKIYDLITNYFCLIENLSFYKQRGRIPGLGEWWAASSAAIGYQRTNSRIIAKVRGNRKRVSFK